MARTLVTAREGDSGEVPFLRGILTRSLQGAGLSFEEAYGVATAVRDSLRDVERISTEALRARVLEHLEPFGKEAVRRYRTRQEGAGRIVVQCADGSSFPLSRGRLRLEMGRSGLLPQAAATAAEALYADLAKAGVRELEQADLQRRTHERLRTAGGEVAAHRYLVWEEFQHSDRPLVILIGGTAGTGKSTLAARLAHDLEIVRTQSTDMLREVMRMMVPERLLPVLHTSSFIAWEVMPFQGALKGGVRTRIIEGFLAQYELLSVACEAVLQRAVTERVSLIVEGVHALPGLRDGVPDDDAIVVQAMVGVLSPAELKRRIQGRGRGVPGRRAKRYLKHFDAIWQIQSFLLAEADRSHVPIVANAEIDRAVLELTGIVMDELGRHFAGTPESALG